MNRVDRSMKNKTMNRCTPFLVHTSTVKKSAATISSQCRLRNSFQVVFQLRSGAGSLPVRSRISALTTVDQPVSFTRSNFRTMRNNVVLARRPFLAPDGFLAERNKIQPVARF